LLHVLGEARDVLARLEVIGAIEKIDQAIGEQLGGRERRP
jgi:hypothetical protein